MEKVNLNIKRIWMFLWPNHILTRKSKNSRMGKGKGSFNRWVLKLRRGTTIVETIGIHILKLNYIVSWFNKQSPLKICLVKNLKLDFRIKVWGSSKVWFTYFDKFRAQ